MGKKPPALIKVDRPAVANQEVEEAIRAIETKIDQLDLSANVTEAAPYDDTQINREIKTIYREIDKLRKSQKAPVEAGDSYASYFKVTKSEGLDLRVDISAGKIYYPGLDDWNAGTLTISSSAGTHYVVMWLSYDGATGVWSWALEDRTTYPEYSVDYVIPHVLAELTVADSVIDEESIIQHQFGPLVNVPGNLELNYSGSFAVFPTTTADVVWVNSGKVLTDLETTSVSGETITIPGTTEVRYLYLQISYTYSGGIETDIVQSDTPLAQTHNTQVVLLAGIVKNDEGGIASITQEQHGDIFSNLTSGYRGAFAVLPNGNDSVYVASGRVVAGTTTQSVSGQSKTISGTGSVRYLYLEITSSSGVSVTIVESGTAPVQTNTIERVLLATIVKDSNGDIFSIDQEHHGNFHSTRVWD